MWEGSIFDTSWCICTFLGDCRSVGHRRLIFVVRPFLCLIPTLGNRPPPCRLLRSSGSQLMLAASLGRHNTAGPATLLPTLLPPSPLATASLVLLCSLQPPAPGWEVFWQRCACSPSCHLSGERVGPAGLLPDLLAVLSIAGYCW